MAGTSVVDALMRWFVCKPGANYRMTANSRSGVQHFDTVACECLKAVSKPHLAGPVADFSLPVLGPTSTRHDTPPRTKRAAGAPRETALRRGQEKIRATRV